MALLIASDIHGSIEDLDHTLEAARKHRVKALLIAGDICPTDNPLFSQLLRSEIPTHVVRGNCDHQWGFSRANIPLPPLMITHQWRGRTVFMTHGDREFDLQALGVQPGDIIVTGHTHVPHLDIDTDQVIWLNPGSVSQGRSRWGATYALLDHRGATIYRLKNDSICFSLSISER